MRKKVIFELSAYEDLKFWQKNNKIVYDKIINLIQDISRFSLNVLDESEALDGRLKGYWSIKIDTEHRLVYKLTKTAIIIIACKYYY